MILCRLYTILALTKKYGMFNKTVSAPKPYLCTRTYTRKALPGPYRRTPRDKKLINIWTIDNIYHHKHWFKYSILVGKKQNMTHEDNITSKHTLNYQLSQNIMRIYVVDCLSGTVTSTRRWCGVVSGRRRLVTLFQRLIDVDKHPSKQH